MLTTMGENSQMSEQAAPEKVLNPTVVKLGLVSLFADISSEMLYPITPLFLTSVLGASMTSVGVIEGSAEAIASLLKTYSGRWSDKILRRKPFVVSGYLLSALAKPAIALAGSWPHVLFARGLDRTGKGLRSAPRDALLAEAVPAKQRGAAFGWHRAMDTLGAAIGPLIAILYLKYWGSELRPLYFFALVPGLAAVVVALFVQENKNKSDSSKVKDALVQPPERPEQEGVPSAPGGLNIWQNMPADFKNYLIAWGLFALTNSSDVFLLMKAQKEGVGVTVVIFLYCFYNLTYALTSTYFGKLSDRIARKKILVFGLCIFSCVYLGFAFATSLWHFMVLFAVYGLYMAATDGVGKALAVDLIDPNQKASGLGLLGTVTGLATIVASSVAGILWDHCGPSWAFYYGIAGALACAITLLKIKTKSEFASAG